MTVGVMANMISVVGFADAEDLSTLNELVRQYGHESVGAVQAAADDLLGLGRAMPLASQLTWKLAAPSRSSTAWSPAGPITRLRARSPVGARAAPTGW